MADSKEVDILLIGKTGNGKSATGNSILRRKAFTSRGSAESVTTTVDYEVSEFNGRTIKVVDGPGVGDNRLNTEGAVNLVMTTMEYAIAANPRGYHAFILVLKFTSRFTAEEQNTILFLKGVFGQDFVKKFCILVLTCGDMFEKESEDSGKSFQEWCKEQQGGFQYLLKECDYRVVLFDNYTKDEAKKTYQLEKLLTVVDNLSSKGERYTDDNFARAREARDRAIVELKKPKLLDKITTETSLILLKLEQLRSEEDLQRKNGHLEKLQDRAECLFLSVVSQDQETEALHELKSIVKSVQKNISDEIKFGFRIMDERAKIRQREEEAQRKIETEMRRLKAEHARILLATVPLLLKEQLVLEQHKQFKEVQKKLIRDMEELNKKEIEEMERRHREDYQKFLKDNEELEKKYREMKTKNDRGIFRQVAEKVTWPLRKAKDWILSKFK